MGTAAAYTAFHCGSLPLFCILGHHNALVLPIKTETERGGEREREREGEGGGAVPHSERVSSWERFALPHQTPSIPPCRRSEGEPLLFFFASLWTHG